MNRKEKKIKQFKFFGDRGVTLAGHEAIMIVAATRVQIDFVPSAISGTVEKMCRCR
jgi:hypothetical protein